MHNDGMHSQEASDLATSVRVDQLIEVAVKNLTGDKVKAYELASQAYGLALDLEAQGQPNHLGRANAQAILSELYYIKADYKNALAHGLKAIDQFENLTDKKLLPVALGAVGITYNRLGDNNRAVDYFYKKKSAGEALRDKWLVGRSYIGLSICFHSSGNNEKAKQYGLEALEIYRELGDLERQTTVLNNLCNYAFYTNDIPEAIRRGRQAEELIDRSEKKMGVTSVVYANLFKAYLSNDEVEIAEKYLEKSASVLSAEEAETHASNFLNKGRFASHVGKHEEAIQHYQKALKLSQERSIHEHTHIACEGIANAHKALGNWE